MEKAIKELIYIYDMLRKKCQTQFTEDNWTLKYRHKGESQWK